MKNVLSRGVTFTCTPIALSSADGPDRRNDDAFETLPRLRFSTKGSCDVTEPSNLWRACEGDRVDLAGSHFGNDSNHAARDLLSRRRLREISEVAHSHCQDIAAHRRDAR